MTDGLFLDRGVAPTAEQMRDALGAAGPLWTRLSEWIGVTYGLGGEPHWSGRREGWAWRWRRSGKSLLVLLPDGDGLRGVLVVGPSVADRVTSLGLAPDTLAAFEHAAPYPDGRWLFLRIADARTCDDIEHLVALKSPPPRKPRARPIATADPPRTT
jgi:hypothetical protein